MNVKRRNTVIALGLACVVGGMGGLTLASATIYRIFCQVTGFGGTTQVAAAGPGRTLERTVEVRFNADVNADLPWSFQPVQRSMTVKLGEENLAHYRATNETSETITGVASFNVTPDKAGIYFSKIHCFCFDEQTLKPGETMDMPVLFFVDPAFADDRKMGDVSAITLSYTFFRAAPDASRKPNSTAAVNGKASGG